MVGKQGAVVEVVDWVDSVRVFWGEVGAAPSLTSLLGVGDVRGEEVDMEGVRVEMVWIRWHVLWVAQ